MKRPLSTAHADTHTCTSIVLSQVSLVQLTLWFVYIAFNYLSVSLVELNKSLYCGYYSPGDHPLFLWPSSFRHSNSSVNKSHFEASMYVVTYRLYQSLTFSTIKGWADRQIARIFLCSTPGASTPLHCCVYVCVCMSVICSHVSVFVWTV